MGHCQLIVLGLVFCLVAVQGQTNGVTVTWNGTRITGPVLIYHDEIIVDPGPTYSVGDIGAPGALVCTSETTARASWRRADHAFFSDVDGGAISATVLNQIRTPASANPNRGRLSRDNENVNTSAANQNGLWCCRVSANTAFVFAGVYRRGIGSIEANVVTLRSGSRFTGSPRFTLDARTSGGPPTTSTWTRDGVEITSGISLEVDTIPQSTATADNVAAYLNTRYISTLIVTGVFPGVYQYSASNRAMASPSTTNITIEGGAVTGLMGTQISLTTVRITWTPPAAAPQLGYQTAIGLTSMPAPTDFVNILAPPHNRTVSETGVHTIVLRSRTRHYPIADMSATVGVLGALPPTTTASVQDATSATISWALQMFSLQVNRYMYSLSRRSSQMLCDDVPDERLSVTTNDLSVAFTDLQEFSIYRLTLTAVFDSFGTEVTAVAMEDFVTPAAAPTGFPSNVMNTTTPNTAMVSWDAIQCIDQNGIITDYTVQFQEQDGGAGVAGGVVNVNDRTYTVSGLTPATLYTFRVAGVTSGGTGPLSTTRVVTTMDGPPGPVLNLMVGPKFTAVQISWDAPQMPNGDITQYEVTYRINGGSLMTNTTELATTFIIIPSLNPGTMVSNISVTAFTSGGRGVVSTAPDFTTPENPELPVVTNVRVEQLTETSVNVSWDAISLPEVTSYTVFYSQVESRKRQVMGELMVEVQGRDQTSVVIEDLVSSVQYQFQVVVVAGEFVGERSAVGEESMLALTTTTAPRATSSGGGTQVGAVVGGIILAIAVVVGIVFLVLFILWFRRRRSQSGSHKPGVDTVRYAKNSAPLMNMGQQSIEPTFDEFPDDTHAVEGESVVFKVIVSGKPLPTLTWYHNDAELVANYAQEILDDGSLNIPSVELKQGGMYKLVAANDAATVEQVVQLTVELEGEKTPDVERKSVSFEPIPVEVFGEYVAQNHGNNNQGFRDQFQGLESGDDYPKTIGLSPEFKKLNRFANITNYDHNRIVLTPIQGHADCESEFVNGCYVDGYSLPKKFIATQGPIPRSVTDFWRLVWQERPPTIVMVTNLKEGNKKKCVQYWPDSGSTTFGPFKVTLTEHQVFADYCIRTMQVSIQGGKPLKLQQFHFTAWPDHGVPDYATPMLAFHRRIASTHNSRRGPMLVHCSAGVGRTGTFICIDNVLEQIKKENVVDLAGIINKMRHQRMKMVQTPEQYIFLHDAMLESVTCGDTQITAADLRLKIKKYDKVDASTGLTTFQSQFNVLEQVSPNISEVICKSANENRDRNRRMDYLPSDRFRVLLKGEHPDYIHAVFAHGYKHQKAYIIAEGPMLSTVRNMLKILYDRKVGAVVMLSGFMENGQESSVQYWPPAEKLVKYGEYTVDLISEEALEGFTIRTLSILEDATQKAHQVTQFHITCWAPDGQCSNLRAVVDCIEEVAKIQRRTGNKPIFVHCNDTVTRSGMFCAMATVIDRCKTEGVVDVFQVVKALRVQKPGAVPTMENYKIVFESILTFLDSFDTYANFQNV